MSAIRAVRHDGMPSSSSRSHHGSAEEFDTAFSPGRPSGKIFDDPLPASPGT